MRSLHSLLCCAIDLAGVRRDPGRDPAMAVRLRCIADHAGQHILAVLDGQCLPRAWTIAADDYHYCYCIGCRWWFVWVTVEPSSLPVPVRGSIEPSNTGQCEYIAAVTNCTTIANRLRSAFPVC